MKNLSTFLRQSGFRCLRLRLVTIGGYSPRDSEWNYSDIPHLNYVHSRVDGFTINSSKNIVSNVFLQKVGWLRFPASVSVIHTEPDLHEYVMTLLNLVISVITTHEASEEGCRTTTYYEFHYSGPVGYLMGIVARYMTRKNYKVLMSEDIPMRNQRGQLRAKGVRFAYDSQDLIGFEETNNIMSDHVDASDLARGSNLDLIDILGTHGSKVVNNYLLHIAWNNTHVSVFPSICPHEGAPLHSVTGNATSGISEIFTCPWHGRKFKSMAEMRRGEEKSMQLVYCNQVLELTLLPPNASRNGTESLLISLKDPEV